MRWLQIWIAVSSLVTTTFAVEELFYRGVGATDDPKYATDCNLIPSNALYIKIVMGSVVDYFRPVEGKTYCEMLQSNNVHEWSSNGKDWVIPFYYSNHLGGSAGEYPSDGRHFLSFWGGDGTHGGCCHNSYSDVAAWNRAFNIFYGIETCQDTSELCKTEPAFLLDILCQIEIVSQKCPKRCNSCSEVGTSSTSIPSTTSTSTTTSVSTVTTMTTTTSTATTTTTMPTVTTTTTPTAVGCISGWSKFRNACYKLFNKKKYWTDAETTCNEFGAHLASIHSQEEADFTASLHDSSLIQIVLIGGQRRGNGFQWIDGTPFDFMYWATGEPNNFKGHENCIHIYSHPGYEHNYKWNDLDCNSVHYTGFLCKKQLGRQIAD